VLEKFDNYAIKHGYEIQIDDTGIGRIEILRLPG